MSVISLSYFKEWGVVGEGGLYLHFKFVVPCDDI